MVTKFLDVLLLLAITFVGDYSIHSFFMYYPIWLSLIVYRLISNLSFSLIELRIQFIFFILITPFLFQNLFLPSSYINYLIFSSLYINAIPILLRILNTKNYIFPLLFLLALSFFSLINISSDSLRSSIIFGPNILYRIAGLLFFIIFIIFNKIRFPRIFIIFSIINLAIIIVASGSRGGMLVLIVAMVAFFHNFLVKKHFFSFIGLLALLILFSIQFFEIFYDVAWRLFYFDLNNNSESGRIYFLQRTHLFFQTGTFSELLFGLGYPNRIYQFYPHNFFLEALVCNGIYMALIIFIFLILNIKSFFKSNYSKETILCFFPIMIGGLVSGSAFDNFTIISVIAYNAFLFITPIKNTK